MPKCEACAHYVKEWAPYIKRYVMTCELPKRNKRCEGNFINKEESNGDTDRN